MSHDDRETEDERPSGEPPAKGAAPDEPEPAPDELDEVDIRDLLRSALQEPAPKETPELLGGVQRKLRRRSRGRFYGDGWSVSPEPRGTYLVTSALMLLVLGVVFLLLVPWTADFFR